jgi:hypothetical protein
VSVEIDVEALAGTQLRGDNELTFIETAIGVKGRDSDGDTTTKNSSNGGGAAK